MQESLHTASNAGIATYSLQMHESLHTASNAGIATYSLQMHESLHTASNAGIATYSLQIQESLHTASECRNRYIEPPMQESLHRAPNAGIPTYGDTRLPYGETRGSRTEKPGAPVRRNPGLPTQESLHTVSKCMNRYIQSPNAGIPTYSLQCGNRYIQSPNA